jgi:response regulator RpfG family c-di-GMP phosphodiesterase
MASIKFATKEKVTSDIFEEKWKILIVDDEPEVHNITKAVLKEFVFEHKKLDFLSAYSGAEAIKIMKEYDDIAVILLDVVMESDDAGLITAKKIREELNNHKVRIILRTGQPGLAPQKEVILNYDINDYKEKTELSSTKLFTTVVTALRSYRDLSIIEQNRIGLKKIITASKSIFQINSLKLFVEGVLTQLVSILNLSHNTNHLKASDAFFAMLQEEEDGNKFEILATTGKFQDSEKFDIMTPRALDLLIRAYLDKQSFFEDDNYVGIFSSSTGNYIFLYLEGCSHLNENDKDFIKIFSSNISIAYENINLHNEIIETQKEVISRLGSVVENRSKETAGHVGRVAKISYLLAKAYGLSEEEAKRIEMSSPMHDVGKVAISDTVLLKPGKFTPEEFETMKEHAQIGYDILSCGKREILRTASIIAHEHHEKWDGSGYPRGLKGEEIHIYGRITAIADVFDALSYERVYKKAWPLCEVLDFLEAQKSISFDPKLIELFFENIEKIKNIQE